jgi:hypothetical protein
MNYWVNGTSYNYADAVTKGWNLTPPNFYMFSVIVTQSKARQYIELNRAVPFEEGDIVFLRKPYAGTGYDVFPQEPRENIRLGTVLELTDHTKGWRARKGSRMINVLWHGTPNQKLSVPIRCLKLSARVK